MWGRDTPACAWVAFAGLENFAENRWPPNIFEMPEMTSPITTDLSYIGSDTVIHKPNAQHFTADLKSVIFSPENPETFLTQ